MHFIIELLVDAGVILLLSYLLSSITISSYGTAILVALVIGLLNATLGALISFSLNLVTFFLLSFLIRLVVTALIIKLADKLFSGFEVRGFIPALILALALAIVGSLTSYSFVY